MGVEDWSVSVSVIDRVDLQVHQAMPGVAKISQVTIRTTYHRKRQIESPVPHFSQLTTVIPTLLLQFMTFPTSSGTLTQAKWILMVRILWPSLTRPGMGNSLSTVEASYERQRLPHNFYSVISAGYPWPGPSLHPSWFRISVIETTLASSNGKYLPRGRIR